MPKQKRNNKKRHGLYLVVSLFMMFLFVNASIIIFQFLGNNSLVSSAAINPDFEILEEDNLVQHYYEDILISNDYFDEIIMSNDSGLIYDNLNDYSGRWLYFDQDDIYRNWEYASEKSGYLFLQMRKKTDDGFDYSRILVLSRDDIANSKNMTLALKNNNDCAVITNNLDLEPILIDDAGQVYNADSIEEGIYTFSILNNEIKIDLMERMRGNYQLTVNYMAEKDNLSLALVVRNDEKELDRYLIFEDIIDNYQKSKIFKIDFLDYCVVNRDLLQKNYLKVFDQENYSGNSMLLTNDIADLSSYIIGNNDISSFKIIGNIEITAYSEKNFKGKSQVFNTNVVNLADTKLGNNNIESIKIKYLK